MHGEKLQLNAIFRFLEIEVKLSNLIGYSVILRCFFYWILSHLMKYYQNSNELSTKIRPDWKMIIY